MTLAVTLVLLAWNTRWRWPVLMLAPAFSLLVSVSRVYLGCITPPTSWPDGVPRWFGW